MSKLKNREGDLGIKKAFILTCSKMHNQAAFLRDSD